MDYIAATTNQPCSRPYQMVQHHPPQNKTPQPGPVPGLATVTAMASINARIISINIPGTSTRPQSQRRTRRSSSVIPAASMAPTIIRKSGIQRSTSITSRFQDMHIRRSSSSFGLFGLMDVISLNISLGSSIGSSLNSIDTHTHINTLPVNMSASLFHKQHNDVTTGNSGSGGVSIQVPLPEVYRATAAADHDHDYDEEELAQVTNNNKNVFEDGISLCDSCPASRQAFPDASVASSNTTTFSNLAAAASSPV
jgi:hypothetical protein